MPIISSSYKAKGLFRNGHFSTIYSAKLRPIPKVKQERQRLALSDGDFIDVDWSFSEEKTHQVAILLHGLEGNAQRVYMRGQAKILVKHGWDVAAMNHRGCSGEENRLYLSYNSGRTEDLAELINSILEKNTYNQIALVGFSLGGNLVLKYLGERDNIPAEIVKAVSISAPLHLRGSLEQLIKFENFVYNRTFINDLKGKYKRKMARFPEQMSASEYKKVRTLLDFDNLYTAPAHGFLDAYDYYEKSSSLQFLPAIQLPVLILNAKNDSFLSEMCYPTDISRHSKNIYLESPLHGGHVGFHTTNKVYYSETRTIAFLNE